MLIRVAFTSPYWSLYDLFVSLFRKGATEELRGLIRKKTLSKEVMLFDSGTSAIYAALKTLKLKEGNLVAVPSFICRAVPRAIVAAGCIPFFIDIDDEYGVDYNSLKKAIKTRKIKAAIIVYQYGKVPSNTKKIISLCIFSILIKYYYIFLICHITYYYGNYILWYNRKITIGPI